MKLNIRTLVTLAIASVLAVAIIAGCNKPASGLTVEEAKEMDSQMDIGHDDENMDETSMTGTEGTDAVTSELVEYKNDDGELACIVMGETIKSKDGAAYQDYEGTRYYFCCDTCPELFAADPKKYIEQGHREPSHGH